MKRRDGYWHLKDWASKVNSGQVVERRCATDWSLLLFIFEDLQLSDGHLQCGSSLESCLV